QLINRVIKPLDLVVISRERIQETLDEAAERGRVTRHDANELVAELVRLARSADRARRSIGVGPSFPISGYDELTAGQVEKRLPGLGPAELRHVREHERRHANRKTVLDAIERALND